MQASFHPTSVHLGGWVLALLGVSVVSGLVLVVVSVRQSRRMNLIHEWRVGAWSEDVFQGPKEWEDINDADDRSAEWEAGKNER
jgi:hypothetical protein